MKFVTLISILLVFSVSLLAQTQPDTSVTEKEFDLEQYFNLDLSIEEREAYKSSIKDFTLQLEQDSLNAFLYLNRGAVYSNLGLNPKAIKDYNQAIKLDSTLAEAYYNRGAAKAKFAFTKDACSDFKKAADLGLESAKVIVEQECK